MKHLLLIILLTIPLQIHAQTSTGEIQGVVTAETTEGDLENLKTTFHQIQIKRYLLNYQRRSQEKKK